MPQEANNEIWIKFGIYIYPRIHIYIFGKLPTEYATCTFQDILCINEKPSMNEALIAVAFKCENAKLKIFSKT